MKCACPTRCQFCGARRRRDAVGHYCPTKNCQWQHGYSMCNLHKKDKPHGPEQEQSGKGNK